MAAAPSPSLSLPVGPSPPGRSTRSDSTCLFSLLLAPLREPAHQPASPPPRSFPSLSSPASPVRDPTPLSLGCRCPTPCHGQDPPFSSMHHRIVPHLSSPSSHLHRRAGIRPLSLHFSSTKPPTASKGHRSSAPPSSPQPRLRAPSSRAGSSAQDAAPPRQLAGHHQPRVTPKLLPVCTSSFFLANAALCGAEASCHWS
jgi:hypothetical protein